MTAKKVFLKDITLVTVSSVKIQDTIEALTHCCKKILFGEVKFISHKKPDCLPPFMNYNQCQKIGNLDDYSRFMLYKLHEYITTPFCLVIHRDGVVLNPKKWRDDFLNYDYIGSPWPIDNAFIDKYGIYQRVGNGGFSLRSKRLLQLPSQLNIPFEPDRGYSHEDALICVTHRYLFEQHGCKFADIDMAKYFAHELKVPEIKGIKPFGFHQYKKQNKHYPKFPSLFTKIKRIIMKDNN